MYVCMYRWYEAEGLAAGGGGVVCLPELNAQTLFFAWSLPNKLFIDNFIICIELILNGTSHLSNQLGSSKIPLPSSSLAERRELATKLQGFFSGMFSLCGARIRSADLRGGRGWHHLTCTVHSYIRSRVLISNPKVPSGVGGSMWESGSVRRACC